jgi:transcriptional regulator with XRE-family HTH domain
MTGAELATLRQACGLTREDLGALAGVHQRTVKHWESGHAGVPADVAATVARLLASINADVSARRRQILDAGRPPGGLVLVRYRTAEDMARFCPDMAGLPLTVHAATVVQLIQALAFTPGLQDLAIRVVYMDAPAYDAWLSACQVQDSDAARSRWAAGQVEGQALPHRPDQPGG